MRLPLLFALMVSVSACAGRYRTEPPVDRLQLRLDIALRTRAQLSYYFVQQGAVERPPMPALVAEVADPPPFDGARWVAGRWAWTNGTWDWHAGYWSDPDVFTTPDSIAYGGSVESEWESVDWIASSIIGVVSMLSDHRTKEHRNTVRDHRTLSSSSWKSSSSPDANVRDHRSESKNDSKKDDDHDKKDYGGGRFVRDHR
jgi:hypothetical protein